MSRRRGPDRIGAHRAAHLPVPGGRLTCPPEFLQRPAVGAVMQVTDPMGG